MKRNHDSKTQRKEEEKVFFFFFHHSFPFFLYSALSIVFSPCTKKTKKKKRKKFSSIKTYSFLRASQKVEIKIDSGIEYIYERVTYTYTHTYIRMPKKATFSTYELFCNGNSRLSPKIINFMMKKREESNISAFLIPAFVVEIF